MKNYERNLVEEDHRKILNKTSLEKPLGDMKLSVFQNYLHFASNTDEEIVDLIAFERILRKANQIAKEFVKQGVS